MAAAPSRKQALDLIEERAAMCRALLDGLRRSRPQATLLCERFVESLEKHRAARDAVRQRFGLPSGAPPSGPIADVDPAGLRQALDDLMTAYAEGLPAMADASTVARLARDMVDVSRLRTVIDLWVESEAA